MDTPSTSTSMYSNIYSEIVHKSYLFFSCFFFYTVLDIVVFTLLQKVLSYFSILATLFRFLFFLRLIQFQCSSNRSSTYIKKVQFQVTHICVKFTIQVRHLNAKFIVRRSLFGRHSVAWPHNLKCSFGRQTV